MIKSSQSNPYGDKEVYGYLCQRCYRKRVEKRSLILIGSAIFSTLIGIFFLCLVIYTQLFVKGLIAEQFFMTIETYTQLGAIFIIFALILVYIRHRERVKMRKKLRSLRNR